MPKPIATRSNVRLEAENFRTLTGFQVEDRNDRTASHRLCVQLAGADVGSITTTVDEPYSADSGRYDIEIRFAGEPDHPCELQLLVNEKPQGTAPQSSDKGGGWLSHTVRGVEVRRGDVIAVQAKGRQTRLDYVQLTALER